MTEDEEPQRSLVSRIWLRFSQLFAALGLTLTPIALGGMYQNVIKWKGWYGLATHYWDENIRQPLQALMSLVSDYLTFQVPVQVTDYLTLGCLYGVAVARASSLLDITNEGPWTPFAFGLGYIIGVLTWPIQYAVLLWALLWLDSSKARWAIFLLSAPFLIFLGLAGFAPNGMIILSPLVLVVAAVSLIVGYVISMRIRNAMIWAYKERGILEFIQMPLDDD